VTIEAVDRDRGRGSDLWASGEHVGPLPAQLDVVHDALAIVVPECAPT
jgi:hypothetical protein